MKRLEDLATGVDAVAWEYATSDCRHNGGSVEEAMNSLKLDHVGVIEYLLNIIEEEA